MIHSPIWYWGHSHSLLWEDLQISRAGNWKECWLYALSRSHLPWCPPCTLDRNCFVIPSFNKLLTGLFIQYLYILRGLWMTNALKHFSFFRYEASGSRTHGMDVNQSLANSSLSSITSGSILLIPVFLFSNLLFILNVSPAQFSVPLLDVRLPVSHLASRHLARAASCLHLQLALFSISC